MDQSKTNKWGLFSNSLSLFIFSYISIRFILFANKYILANIYNIDTIRTKFILRGISPADSPVWNYFTVLTFYSSEIFSLIFIILISYFIFKKHRKRSGVYKYILFWFLVTSLLLLLSTIISGILTRTNAFHFFNWIHLPYAISIILAFGLIISELFLSRRISNYFLRFGMSLGQKSEKNYFNLFPKYLLSAFLPIFLGIILLYLPNISTMHKYDYIEVFTVLIFFSAGFIFKYDKGRRIQNDNISKVNIPLVCLSFLSYFSYVFIEIF